jgi:hypothetical protein
MMGRLGFLFFGLLLMAGTMYAGYQGLIGGVAAEREKRALHMNMWQCRAKWAEANCKRTGYIPGFLSDEAVYTCNDAQVYRLHEMPTQCGGS